MDKKNRLKHRLLKKKKKKKKPCMDLKKRI
jgi:hypothetical protein